MCHFCSDFAGENLVTWPNWLLQRLAHVVSGWGLCAWLIVSITEKGGRQTQDWVEGTRNHPQMRCSLNWFSGVFIL